VLKTGRPTTSELFEPHLNAFIEIRAIPRLDPDGKVVGLIHVVRDITERKKAEETIKRQVERLRALRTIDMAITASRDIHTMLHVFVGQVQALLNVDAVAVYTFDRRTHSLEFAVGKGFRTDALRQARVTLGKCLTGMVALERKPMRVFDLLGSEERPAANTPPEEEFKAYVGVPLIAKGHVVGVLEVYHRSPLSPETEWLDFLDALAPQAAIGIEDSMMFAELERSRDEIMIAYDTAIEGWSRALDFRDKETEGHSRRVTGLSLEVARRMGMGAEELAHMRRGALLHDIGKLGVPDGILLKPGKLTEEEWKVMKRHTEIAFELLAPIPFLRQAIDVPYCHHEKWDGSGYPRGLKGEAIPLAARVFSVVDVWDALRSDRPYRPAWSEEKTVEYIRSLAGKEFDPRVVEVFLAMVGEGGGKRGTLA
jgi:HD-GYP domain-containing protein (c-di-GMP phosphodiesterase class II)